MRIRSKHFWFEIGVALSLLCLFPFYAQSGGGPEQMIVPDIIINTPDPGMHWLTTLSVIVGILAAGVGMSITLIKWLKNQKGD